jgi:hypothetical protein
VGSPNKTKLRFYLKSKTKPGVMGSYRRNSYWSKYNPSGTFLAPFCEQDG